MTSDHESIFSYGITRPYPFRWLTPVALAGFLVATVLFSFLNFASNGYDLIIQTTSDPNATISEGIWFQNWPSYLASKVKPSCQSVDIPVNSLLFTNQTALTYTLTNVWQEIPDMPDMPGRQIISPSLTYFNNVIEWCNVTSIEVDLEALDRSASQIAYSEWGASVSAYVTCVIEGAAGTTAFGLTTIYDYVPSTISYDGFFGDLGKNFLDTDSETKSSLYWGESLMSMYWVYLTRSMQDIRANATNFGEAGIRKGTISLSLPHGLISDDITDLSFFGVNYTFVVDKGLGDFSIISPSYNESTSVGYLDSIKAYPNVWIIIDSLAKSTYSTIMTDLGQVASIPNILNNGDTLQYFTSNFSLALQHTANAAPGPATMDYNTLGPDTGDLGINPSVLSTTYICQVPQLKSAGNLFLAVLVADLVFLQALWKIFVLTTDWFLLRKRPNANYCQGCGNDLSRDQSRQEEVTDSTSKAEDGQIEQVELDMMDRSKRRFYHRKTSSQRQLLLRQ